MAKIFENPKTLHSITKPRTIDLQTCGRESLVDVFTRDIFDLPAIIFSIAEQLQSPIQDDQVIQSIRCLSPILAELSSLPGELVRESHLIPLLVGFSFVLDAELTDLPLRALQLLLYLSPISVPLLLESDFLHFFNSLSLREGLPFGSHHLLLGIAQKIIETPGHNVDSSDLLCKSLSRVLALDPTSHGVERIVLAALELIDAFLRNEQLFHIESTIPQIMAFVGHYLQHDDQIILSAGIIFAIMSDLYEHGFHEVVHEILPIEMLSQFIHNKDFLIHLEAFATLETQIIKAGQGALSDCEVAFLLSRLPEAKEFDDCKATTGLLMAVASATGLRVLFYGNECRVFVDRLRDEARLPCYWCRMQLSAIYWAGFLAEHERIVQIAFLNETTFLEELTGFELEPMIPELIRMVLTLESSEKALRSELTVDTFNFLREACASWLDSDIEPICALAKILSALLSPDDG
jgi:hypothetical protein